MVVSFMSRMTVEQQLEIHINKSNFIPKKTDVSHVVENILLCYEYDLEDLDRNYFSETSKHIKRIDDIIEYVNFYGGFKQFDFDLDEEEGLPRK